MKETSTTYYLALAKKDITPAAIKKARGAARAQLLTEFEKKRLIFVYIKPPGQALIKASTGCYASKKEWLGGKSQKVSEKYNTGTNAILEELREYVKSLFDHRSTARGNKKVLIQNKIDELNGRARRNDDLANMETFIEHFIRDSAGAGTKGRKSKRPNTIKAYLTTLKRLKEFCAASGRPLEFSEITLDFYSDFVKYLQTHGKGKSKGKERRKGLADGSIGKHVKTLKTFMQEALEEDLHNNLEFQKKKFAVTQFEPETVYLDEDELMKITRLDLSERPLLVADRDLFIFNSWIGVRYSDLISIRPNHISLDPRAGKVIRINTTKTNEPVVIPLHPIAEEIFTRYSNALPAIRQEDNPQFNENLKTIAQLAGIDQIVQHKMKIKGEIVTEWVAKFKMISAHTARRSFATNLYLRGVPSQSIMAVTGHRTEKSFNRYIRVTKDQHAEILRKSFDQASKMKIA